ncbi:putative D-alanyl-D-alanine carboxypeptidase [Selenomonas ruminantium subsp. lactilytica TAM6421]|uniref:serine-type D-Ala-D-Ala carboxypeptidase n=1 Tax=Selenomonas ruminantium subsp. lactilytica (strain NBRC 103574 / TAM6421) TaxID=927704 RepID=I0GRC6_SELRL|nr:D-alanyl-D-alanine carboxypeptidase family protein [Selenomonas ruminantium]BAL83313.1 putative D-alanyl-D-alanine carboxypeptidase [Selenomonas ruminantium subsp. lactilytica TAM6421]
MKVWQKIFSIFIGICMLVVQLPVAAGEGGEPDITAQAAIIIEASTGRVIWEKNADERLYPASMTKMMTGILALEQMNLRSDITMSSAAAHTESSPLGVLTGERIRTDELLNGMLLESDNGAAVALAEAMAGNVQSFAGIMNGKAAELDMKDTHFVNPNGLTEAGHYSTARDMAKLARYAMQNKAFREIVEQPQRVIRWESPKNKSFQAHNTNKLLGKYTGMTGIKTGWTQAAGGCLAAGAKRNGVELIVVLMKAPTLDDRFTDAAKLLDYGFEHVKITKALSRERVSRRAWVTNGQQASVDLYPARDINFPLINGEDKSHYSLVYHVPKVVEAPLKAGTPVGQIVVRYNGQDVEHVDMLAENVNSGFSFGSFFVKMFSWVLKLV